MSICFILEILIVGSIPYLIVDGISLLKNIFPSINSLVRWFVRRLGEYDISIQSKQIIDFFTANYQLYFQPWRRNYS